MSTNSKKYPWTLTIQSTGYYPYYIQEFKTLADALRYVFESFFKGDLEKYNVECPEQNILHWTFRPNNRKDGLIRWESYTHSIRIYDTRIYENFSISDNMTLAAEKLYTSGVFRWDEEDIIVDRVYESKPILQWEDIR